MKYSHRYSKLYNDNYTTIRRRAQKNPKTNKVYKVGDITKEIYPSSTGSDYHFHYVKIKKIERKKFSELSNDFLYKDSDCKLRKDAIKLFNSFYRNPINEQEKMYIYYMEVIY